MNNICPRSQYMACLVIILAMFFAACGRKINTRSETQRYRPPLGPPVSTPPVSPIVTPQPELPKGCEAELKGTLNKRIPETDSFYENISVLWEVTAQGGCADKYQFIPSSQKSSFINDNGFFNAYYVPGVHVETIMLIAIDPEGRPTKNIVLVSQPFTVLPIRRPDPPVSNSCSDTTKMRTFNTLITFESTWGQTCVWEYSSNENKVVGYRKQTKSVRLPKDSTLCSIELVGGSNNVRYDDFMFITVERHVMASTSLNKDDFINAGMSLYGPLIFIDDENKLYNITWDNGHAYTIRKNAICPGPGSCRMVHSDKYGPFLIYAPPEWFNLLPPGVLKRREFDLEVWVTGNNVSPGTTDCQHSGLSFNVKVTYEPGK